MSDFKVAILLTALIMGGLALLSFVHVSSEQLVVTKKEMQSEFKCSSALTFLSCGTYYSYFVNGEHVSGTLYNEMKEGNTYNCGRSVLGGLIGCEEVEE